MHDLKRPCRSILVTGPRIEQGPFSAGARKLRRPKAVDPLAAPSFYWLETGLPPMMREEYETLDAIGLAGLIRSGEASASEVLELAIARTEEVNSSINAVVQPLFEAARQQVRDTPPDAPLAGVPFLVKDLVSSMAEVPTSRGNKLWLDRPAVRDSEMVRRFRAAGLVIFGKTNTPEFGLTPYTESRTLGPARNPYDLGRTPGGSSGGAGAAVAARIVPMASGGDGGGSIRIPASACGVFGLKPTRARNPSGPFIGQNWHGFAIEHVLSRTVRDSALMLDLTHGADIGAPYHAPFFDGSFLAATTRPPRRLKIAASITPLLGKEVDREVVAIHEKTVELLGALGHEVVEATPPVARERFALDFVTILAGEMRAEIEETAEAFGTTVRAVDFDPQTFGLGLFGEALTASDFARASRRLFAAAREIAEFFEDYDVLLTPTLAVPPVPIGALEPTNAEKRLIGLIGTLRSIWILKRLGLVRQLAEATFSVMPWTPVFNVTGQPAMSVPLGWSRDGLPIGMHFAGKFGDEETLFGLAAELETAAPWSSRRPQFGSA